MENIWSFMLGKIEAGFRLMLIVVIEVRGSSPGKKGFKMAVSSDGESYGSIGGGPMEYQLKQLSLKELDSAVARAFLKNQVHSANAGEEASGLICAGSQNHAFIMFDEENLDLLHAIQNSIATGSGGVLSLSAGGASFTAGNAGLPLKDTSAEPESWCYEERLVPDETVYIFGGGHISNPMSEVCRMLGFRVIVLDDRENLPTMEENAFAHQKKRIDYTEANKEILFPQAAYVVIMTVSHASDQLILGQMVHMPLKYLGMIGSRNKVKTIFENLRIQGVSEERLQEVHSPMGIPIKSETPAEIAISIAAEIIQVKNAGR
ncbi:MAG: XdhC/CoxI family protein [Bacteroidia bacterium]|nr:MAG: XdhC/CoxI family protein [Bacteroidia bacterium]